MTVRKIFRQRDAFCVKVMKLVFSVLLFSFCGCTSVISEGLRREVSEGITFGQVTENPDAHKGKVIILSGIILDAKNMKDGTLMEILQKPASDNGRPKDVDNTGGRFLGLHPDFLDVAIYGYGREVTIGGEVTGKKSLPLGEIEYTYPVVSIKEIYLWPPRIRRRPPPPLYRHYPRWYHPYPYHQP